MITTASLAEIKKALGALSPMATKELCLRLARYKKENKELLSYLLFEAGDEDQYIRQVKEEIDAAFETVHKTNLYNAKKTIRKILRITNKYIKYSGSKQTETELLIWFCRRLSDSGIAFRKSTTLHNLYMAQLKKIGKAVSALHEDLQYDYAGDIALLAEKGH